MAPVSEHLENDLKRGLSIQMMSWIMTFAGETVFFLSTTVFERMRSYHDDVDTGRDGEISDLIAYH
jgi:hypothetical protein